MFDPSQFINEISSEVESGISENEVLAYIEKKKQVASLEKEVKSIGDKIKSYLIEKNATKAKLYGVEFKLNFQNRATMDEEKLLELLKERQLNNAIITVEKPNAEMLPQLIAEGKLTESDISTCMINNWVPTLNVSKSKTNSSEPKITTNKSSMF